MFNSLSPSQAYKTVALETSVSTADPHRLILLLFEGARAAISNAKFAIGQGNSDQKGSYISKAVDIIGNGLRVSLDREKGGDLAAKLDALYDYMVRRLVHANSRNDAQALVEVDELLGEIHTAWQEIGDTVRNDKQSG